MTGRAALTRTGGVVRRFAEPVVAAIGSSLRQGLTPEGMAMSLAAGAAVGLFPLVGTTTLLGLALVLPLVRLGERMAGASLATLAPGALGDASA
jgi:uncharacterized protein (DUF2062 family)